MKKINIAFLAMVTIAVFSVGCAKKGEPSKQGDLLSVEQIKALANDQSMNGKLVSIEGYAGLCNNSMFVTKGKKNKMTIHSDGICKGEELIDAQIEISAGSIPLSGEKSRNYASFPDEKNITDESLTFMTDDYQELKNQKLKFSGTIIYDGKNYYLDNVTIHK